MLFSLTNPEVAILMMGLFLFAVLLGFPIAFTLMAMGNIVEESTPCSTPIGVIPGLRLYLSLSNHLGCA